MNTVLNVGICLLNCNYNSYAINTIIIPCVVSLNKVVRNTLLLLFYTCICNIEHGVCANSIHPILSSGWSRKYILRYCTADLKILAKEMRATRIYSDDVNSIFYTLSKQDTTISGDFIHFVDGAGGGGYASWKNSRFQSASPRGYGHVKRGWKIIHRKLERVIIGVLINGVSDS